MEVREIMAKIEAVKDKVVARVIPEEEKTAGGIVIPAGSQKNPQVQAEVESVGSEVEEIEVGDIILCHQQGGQELMFNEQRYKCLMYSEIYGKMKE